MVKPQRLGQVLCLQPGRFMVKNEGAAVFLGHFLKMQALNLTGCSQDLFPAWPALRELVLQRQDGRETIALSAQQSATHIGNDVVGHGDGGVVQQRQNALKAPARDKDQRDAISVLMNQAVKLRPIVQVVWR